MRIGVIACDMIKRELAPLRRGLYIDTGVGDEETRAKAQEFCRGFSLRYEETTAQSPILAEHLAKAKVLGRLRRAS
jgi:hypothetical protein